MSLCITNNRESYEVIAPGRYVDTKDLELLTLHRVEQVGKDRVM